jgi:hypothetical protein
MVRVLAVVLLLVVALVGTGGQAAASSDAAADRACVGQFTSDSSQIDGLRPVGETVISPAAQDPNFGNLQSYVAVRCDVGPLAKRYSI